jgi:hypothetical protein
MSDLLELIQKVNRYLGMFLPGKTYGEFVALIYGFDLAKGQKPLEGFKEWLVVKYGEGNNLTWSALALFGMQINLLSFVEGSSQLHKQAIEELTKLISEFDEERQKQGIKRIIDSYQDWLRNQDWYRS